MIDSILSSVKHAIGLTDSYTPFDNDLKILINSAFATLTQLGVGPEEGFTIEGFEENWSDFIGEDKRLSFVQTYIFLKTRVLFDPPSNSFVMEAMNNQIKELEWRLNVQVDPGEEESDA